MTIKRKNPGSLNLAGSSVKSDTTFMEAYVRPMSKISVDHNKVRSVNFIVPFVFSTVNF